MPEFENILNDFLAKEKRDVLFQSIISKSLAIVEQELFVLEIKQQSLKESANSLDEKLKKFNLALDEITKEKTQSEYLLKGEIQHLIKEVIEEDIGEFRQKISEIITNKAKKYFASSDIKGAEKLRVALDNFVSQDIQEKFNQFKNDEEEKVNKLLETALNQFEERINGIINKIMQISAELFDISFDALKMERGITKKSEFHFGIDDIKVGLEMIADSLSSLLPNAIRRKKILKQTEEQIIQQMDMYSGRLRFDFAQRMQKAEINIKVRLNQEIDEIILSISEAIRVGDTLREKSDKEMAEEEKRIENKFSQLSQVKEKLTKVKNLQ
jgi:hypothetical protein